MALACGCSAGRVAVPLVSPRLASRPAPIFWSEPFDTLDSSWWREIDVRRRRTHYRITEVNGRRCLHARSHQGASILISGVRFNPGTYAWLSWDWRVDRLVEGEALDRKEGSDAAARVYVYFDTHGMPWQKRSLDYVWSASRPVGTILSSAFSPESKIIVAASGRTFLGRWRHVSRNLKDDYASGFGGPMPPVIAIGLMTDTDNTGGEAEAYFDDLAVSRDPIPRP